MESNFQVIADLVAEDNVQEALESLLSGEHQTSSELKNSARLLLSRYHALEKKVIAGALSHQEHQIALNQIKLDLMNLLHSRRLKEAPGHRLTRRLISAFIYLLIGGFVIWSVRTPKKGLQIELQDFRATRVGFMAARGADLFSGYKVSDFTLSNFDLVEVPVDSLELRLLPGQDSIEQSGGTGLLTIEPIPGITGVSVNMNLVNLEDLEFRDSTLIVISQVPNNATRFRAQMQQTQELNGVLNYSGEATLSTSYVILNHPGMAEEYYDPVELSAIAAPGTAKEIRFGGPGQDLFFEFSLTDAIEEKEFNIDHIEFYQPEADQIKSSLLSGNLIFRETDHEPLNSISLSEGNRVDLKIGNRLLIQNIRLDSGGIFLEATGTVDEVFTFEGGERRLRNPTIARWWWHNRAVLLVLLSILLVAILILTPVFFSPLLVGMIHPNKLTSPVITNP